ncbi:MAG: cytochrome c-type biogenesis protein CcmH [Burkholderiaceae bacterium]|nr:cytochrome c-type biogenesis protein CcmH [Burkholderiaceae bacterium]
MSQPPDLDPPLDAAAQARLKTLSEELRCLVCQNQTLADSNAELAVDLRREVQRMIAGGRSDKQIKTYLVERYGDFVLYDPPVQANTIALWFAPFVLLLIGAIIWAAVQRRSRLRVRLDTTAAQAQGSEAGAAGPAAAAPPAREHDRDDRERARRMLGLDEER